MRCKQSVLCCTGLETLGLDLAVSISQHYLRPLCQLACTEILQEFRLLKFYLQTEIEKQFSPPFKAA